MAVQNWRRLGRIFVADGRNRHFASHATYPTPLPLANGNTRIYFSPRDAENRSSIVYLDLALDGDRFDIVHVHDAPVLTPGARGAFDDSGVTVSSVVTADAGIFLYYLGWSLSTTVPFRNFIGLAASKDGGDSFTRHSLAPIVDRSDIDPLMLGYPWVLRTGASWRMWYGSHLEWGTRETEIRHVIKDAVSADGVAWRRAGHVAIALGAAPEFAVSRPCVVRDADKFRMWYARRHPDYSIGYAESDDAERWVRRDADVEFSAPAGEWDSDSATYPCIFDHGGARYMLYNGNGYGRTGFGLARLEG